MMLDLKSILVFSEDPKKLSGFYKKVFQKAPDWEMEGYYGFNAGNTFLTFGPHDKVSGKNPNPDRMMYNFETRDVKGEFERIKGLGAQVVAEPYQMGENADGWIATFADPDGNYFQLMTPWEAELTEE
jgi:predicted enzyme related to lactoylglutathione lyase